MMSIADFPAGLNLEYSQIDIKELCFNYIGSLKRYISSVHKTHYVKRSVQRV